MKDKGDAFKKSKKQILETKGESRKAINNH
jgi:hypothetical protein